MHAHTRESTASQNEASRKHVSGRTGQKSQQRATRSQRRERMDRGPCKPLNDTSQKKTALRTQRCMKKREHKSTSRRHRRLQRYQHRTVVSSLAQVGFEFPLHLPPGSHLKSLLRSVTDLRCVFSLLVMTGTCPKCGRENGG